MKRILFATSVCVILFSALDVRAQYSSEVGIMGSGQVVLERPADRMRMQIDVLAKSTKDLPDAVAKLKARQAKAEKQLETLGAIKDSIKFAEVRIDESQDDNQRQIQMMMRQRMASGRGKKPTKEALAKPIKVAMKLTAEWPLQGGDATAQLVSTKKLQDAIKAADLGGLKDAEEPTAEEAEAAEEADMEMMSYGGRQGPKPGEPAFIFSTKIAPADMEKARSDAYRSAKQEATQLAKAADMEIGPLRSLHASNGVDTDDSESYQYMYNSGYGNMLRRQMNGSESGEAIGASPGLLKYRVGVTASFEIKPASK